MYAGRMVERAAVGPLFRQPLHPYTQGLMRSIIRLEEGREARLRPIPGIPPDLTGLPTGCRFRNRCPAAVPRCAEEDPAVRELAPGHVVACHRAGEVGPP
jgi:oligopeptide/dipeptide ABC transporter ATP-binding protein